MELTVGQVSGIIAVGVVVVRFLFPNLLVFLFLGTLSERNDSTRGNAISWSSIGRFLHSSLWPTILNTDTAAFSSVSLPVVVFRCVGLAGAFLISIAAVVTPLGLFEAVVPDPHPQVQPFRHAVDYDIFGKGTPSRNQSVPFTRRCYQPQSVLPRTCPDLAREGSSSDLDDPVDFSIPDETISLFNSGLSAGSNTISSIGDIQWRSWSWEQVNNRTEPSPDYHRFNKPYPVGVAQQIGVMAMNDKYEVIEGLVVDTKDGGIGFRNHSVPPLSPYGSTWAEDLLFVQPVTACVDTNLTLEYTVPLEDNIGLKSATEITLVDRGGFVNLDHTVPRWDWTKAQSRPEDLWTRAYEAAWLNNVYAMKVLNVSTIHVTDDPNDPVHILGMNSTLGQGFHMGGGTDCFGFDHPRHMSVEGYGCFLWQDYPDDMAAEIAGNCPMRTFGPASGKLNHIAVYCGLYLGAAHPLYEQEQAVHGKESVILMPGTKWIKPMYSCVTAVEARIKTVTFAFNTTDDLSADDLRGLTVQKIVDKRYARDQNKPLWGVENFENWSPSVLPPLWGLVSPEAVRNMRNSAQSQFQIIQKESLLLPSTGFTIFQGSNHNMPGAQFHTTALGLIDKLGVYRTDTTTADYTGYSNLAMAQRWSNLSRSVHTVGKVVNLIWTDGAANIVVGTKGCAANSNTVIQRAVTVSRLRIRYELPYAVPAVVVLGILAFIAVLTLFALLLGRTSLSKMSRYLNATSAGRIMTAVLQSPTETVDNDTPSGDWVQRQGRAGLVVGKERPELVPSGPHDPTGALLGGEETLEGKPGTITATVLRS